MLCSGNDRNNIAKAHGDISIFGRLSEWIREGNYLYMEIKESGVTNEQNLVKSKVVLVYGQMNELLRTRMRVGLTALTMVEYKWIMTITYQKYIQNKWNITNHKILVAIEYP